MSTSSPIPQELPIGRQSISWQVNAEPAVGLGGGRALLLQVAHPGVGAGVEQHSTYARDPWGRLFRTVDIMIKMSFADPDVSARQVRVLEKMHRRVKGTTDAGDSYSAFDVDLQLWVWATLVETALFMYEKVQRPLSARDRERYYQESKLMAYGCGVPHGACPETWDDFAEYFARVVAEDLHVTRSARSVAVAAMNPPLPGPLAGSATYMMRLLTAGLMPESLREQYGFEWDSARQRRLDRFMTVMAVVSRPIPAPLRHVNAQIMVRRRKPLRIPWLQRRGAELTARRMEAAGFAV